MTNSPVALDAAVVVDVEVDLSVANELAESHVPLVAHLVREVMARVPSHVDRDDLRSAGLVALVKASRSYDESRGVAFGAYAASRVRGALLDELRSVDWASRSVRRKSREIEETRQRLASALGQFPDDVAVAASLGIEVGEIAKCEKDVARAGVTSLDAGTEAPLAELVRSTEPGPEASLEMAERLEYLTAAIAELPERLRRVVEGYFLEELPMVELAEELGVTESRISQIRAEALVLLKDALNAALAPELVQPAARPGGVVARRRDAYVAAVAARQVAARRTTTLRTVAIAG
jgi:RNA polymerase sigma factor for flagellar operon FliA